MAMLGEQENEGSRGDEVCTFHTAAWSLHPYTIPGLSAPSPADTAFFEPHLLGLHRRVHSPYSIEG